MIELRDWENPLVTRENRRLSHVPLGAYPDAGLALKCARKASPFMTPLNGTWEFHLAPNPLQVPEGFFKEGFDISSWADLTVPGNWQLQGFTDPPIYTITHYPFSAVPPFVPENNPTGCHRTSYNLNSEWIGWLAHGRRRRRWLRVFHSLRIPYPTRKISFRISPATNPGWIESQVTRPVNGWQ